MGYYISIILTHAEETPIVVFPKHKLLPLDDYLYTLKDTIPIPFLARSSLHRYLQRHGISTLPETDKTPKGALANV